MQLTETLLEQVEQGTLRKVRFNIAVEVQRMFRPQKHGMDIVAQEICKRLPTNQLEFDFHLMVKNDTDKCLASVQHRFVHALRRLPYFIWEQFALPKACHDVHADLLHCMANTAPVRGKTPLLLTLHDLIFMEKLPRTNSNWYQRLGNVYRRKIVKPVAKRAVRIITVSDFQRNIIAKKLNIDKQKIAVIHNGADDRFFVSHSPAEIARKLEKYKLEPGYIFFMANTDPRKNTTGTLQAYARLKTINPEAPKLVMNGLKGHQLLPLLQTEGLEWLLPHIKLTGYIKDTDLPFIYQGASMLWFPSFSEGFGLPIVEAMASGTPVISSQASCMPEIAGEAALYIDPNDPTNLAFAANLLLKDEDLCAHLITEGRKRAKLFTWDAAVTKLMKIYEELEMMIDHEYQENNNG